MKNFSEPKHPKWKDVQVHFECACGRNFVDTIPMAIKWKDFKILGIVRKKDKKTGKYFLYQYDFDEICFLHDPEKDDPDLPFEMKPEYEEQYRIMKEKQKLKKQKTSK